MGRTAWSRRFALTKRLIRGRKYFDNVRERLWLRLRQSTNPDRLPHRAAEPQPILWTRPEPAGKPAARLKTLLQVPHEAASGVSFAGIVAECGGRSRRRFSHSVSKPRAANRFSGSTVR